MATDVNKRTRKRKASSDLIFEVNEADFSPSTSPELNEEKLSSCITESNNLETSKDVTKILETSEIVLTTTEISSEGSIIKLQKAMTKEELRIEESNISNYVSELTTENSISRLETPKADVDLRCMDMEVENSPTSPCIEKPFVSLIFRNKDIANNLKPQIINFIRSIVGFELFEINNSDLTVNLWENISISEPPVNDTTDNFENKVAEAENNDSFVVDTTPSRKPELLPRYLPNRCSTIGESDSLNGVDNNFRSTLSCFNCDGNHSIKDCNEVRNFRRIQQARNKYLSQSKTVRYHIDDELKYKHLVPGKISEQLRRALDVRKNEIPPYIYRMRVLGYPPGWLQEALISNSKLELFDFQGSAIMDDKGDNRKIDSNKIIDYPGFNVPHAKGFKDEYKYYNCPPYNENFSKQSMLNYIEKITEQVVVKPETCPPISETKNEEDSNSQESEITENIRRSISPTLNDLELRKRQLLAELEEGSLNSPQSTNNETNEKSAVSTPTIESPSVVSSLYGTPLLKSASCYAHLPDRDKFAKDISEVINFENLPDSTGKYEQMSKVLDKVRTVVKNNSKNNS